jgi:hypothetical protein
MQVTDYNAAKHAAIHDDRALADNQVRHTGQCQLDNTAQIDVHDIVERFDSASWTITRRSSARIVYLNFANNIERYVCG